MSRRQRIFSFFVLVLVGLYAVHRTWPYLYYREPIRHVGEARRLVQPLPEDDAAAVLVALSDSLKRPPFDYPHFHEVPLAEVTAYRDVYADTLARFWRWYDNGGKQAIGPQAATPNAARFHLFELDVPLGEDPFIGARNLGRLLLTQAHLEFSAGRTEAGRRALLATFELAHFHLQNPDLFLSVVGYMLLNNAQYYLSEIAPATELTRAWEPYLADRDLLTSVWHKVHWLYSVSRTNFTPTLLASLDLIDDAPCPWLRRIGGGYHVGHTQNLLYQAHQDFCRDVAGPLNDRDFEYHRLTKPLGLLSFNPIGRTFLAVQSPEIKNFIWMDALITARADVLRVRIALAEAGLPWQQTHIVQQLEAQALINPFSGQPYRVGDDHRVLLLAPEDPRWRDMGTAKWAVTGMVGPSPAVLAR